MNFNAAQVESASYSQSGIELKIRVERFLADGSEDPVNPQWIVPVVVGTPANPRAMAPHTKTLLETPQTTLQIKGVNPKDWITVSDSDFTLDFCSICFS